MKNKSEGKNMSNSDISSKIIIRNKNTLEEVSLEQEFTKLRAGSEIMAFHYKAPLYLTIDLERYFEGMNSSTKLEYNIGDTGWTNANFRGLIDGKDHDLNEDYDYKILVLEEYKCISREEIASYGKSSEFKQNFTIENH